MSDRDPGLTDGKNLPFKPSTVDRDPGFSKTMPGPDRDPGMTKPTIFGPASKVGPPQGVRTPEDRGNISNRSVGAGIASNLFNNAKGYVTNLGRSVRDVPTALGTALDSKGAMAAGTNGMPSATTPIKNLATQIGQVGSSVLGKRDSDPSDKYVGPNKTYQNNLVRPQRGGRGR